jgi:O-antigen/teichoic acid export membrane protein
VSSPLKNFSILATGETIGKVMGFATTVYLARVLGAEGFGYIGFVTALYGYVALIANPGFETVGTREIAAGKIPAQDIVSSIFILRGGLSAIGFCVLLVVAFVSPFPPLMRTLVLIQACNVLLVPFMFQFFFRGTKDMSAIAYSRITQSFAYLALVFFLVSSKSDLVLVPILFVAANLISLLPLNVRVLKEFPVGSFHVDNTALKAIARHSLRVGGAAILVQIYISFDTVLLGYMRTAQEVGVYTAAYKIITFLTLIPALIFQTYLPELSNPTGETRHTPVLHRYQTILILTGIPVGIVGILCSRAIIVGIFGAAFESGVLPFQILLVSTTLIYFNIAIANPLLAWGKEKEYLFIVGAGACVNLLLNIVLIPEYGIVGAATATLAAESTVFVVALVQRQRLRMTTAIQQA